MDKKIGAYICSGCGIGEALTVERLVRKATAKGAKVVKTHACLCGDEGNALIAADVANEGVNTVLVAACSPRAMVDAFRLDVPILERVNLREHVVWSHEPKTEGTQALAEDYIAMGLVRLQKTLPPEPFIQETSKRILVVGGGLTGLAAAEEAAAAGYEVVLVEQAPRLGGWLAQAWKDVPQQAPYRELEAPAAAEKARAVAGQPEDPRHHRRRDREDRRPAGPLRRHGEDRGRRGDAPRRRHRARHRRPPLRGREARAPRVRRQPGRHHVGRPRGDGREGRDPAPLRPEEGEERALRPVRRLARRQPPPLLLGHLLRELAQAGASTCASATRTRRSRSSTATCAPPARGNSSTSAPRRTPGSSSPRATSRASPRRAGRSRSPRRTPCSGRT